MWTLRTSTLLAGLCAALAIACPRPGAAQPKGPTAAEKPKEPAAAEKTAAAPASDSVTDQARELYVKGAKHYEKGEWTKAHAAFLASFRLKPHWSTAGNLGACEMKLGMYRDAAEHLAFSLREQPTDSDPAGARRTSELLGKARAYVGRVTIQVNIDGAEVAIDRRPIGKAPLTDEVFVEAGERVIEATRTGYKDARQVVRAEPGSAQTVSLTLVPAETPGGKRPPVAPEATPSPVPWLITGAAVTAVGLGIGIGLTAAANGKASEAGDTLSRLQGGGVLCGSSGAASNVSLTRDCAALVGLREGQSTLSNGAATAFLIGGVAAVATTVTYVLWPARGSKRGTNVRAAPVVSGGTGGVRITGTF